MLTIKVIGEFKRNYKLAVKRGCNPADLETVLEYLKNEKPLPEKYRDHQLTNYAGYKRARECHISPDWLLVYQVHKDVLILELLRLGTHSDLF
jgi:mRNA interferase YafQ